MTGVVIRCDGTYLALRRHEAELVEKFVHIADLRRPRRAFRLLAVVPVVAVILQHGTATGDIINNRVKPLDWKCNEILIGKHSRWLARTGVKVNRTTASLSPRHVDIA